MAAALRLAQGAVAPSGGFTPPEPPVGYLNQVMLKDSRAVVESSHGTGWEADDRQGDDRRRLRPRRFTGTARMAHASIGAGHHSWRRRLDAVALPRFGDERGQLLDAINIRQHIRCRYSPNHSRQIADFGNHHAVVEIALKGDELPHSMSGKINIVIYPDSVGSRKRLRPRPKWIPLSP